MDWGGGLVTAFMAAKDVGKGKTVDADELEEPGQEDQPVQGGEYQQGYDDGFRDARNKRRKAGMSGWGR
jgi:hypothetical protein